MANSQNVMNIMLPAGWKIIHLIKINMRVSGISKFRIRTLPMELSDRESQNHKSTSNECFFSRFKVRDPVTTSEEGLPLATE